MKKNLLCRFALFFFLLFPMNVSAQHTIEEIIAIKDRLPIELKSMLAEYQKKKELLEKEKITLPENILKRRLRELDELEQSIKTYETDINKMNLNYLDSNGYKYKKNQVQTSELELNDSVAFLQVPKMVVDTAKVEEVSMTFVKKQKENLTMRKDSLLKDVDVMNIIINMDKKDKLSDENGTMAIYSQLFEELKGNAERAVTFQFTKPIYGGATPQWQVQYNQQKENIEKMLIKKQQTHPVVVEYVKWVRKSYLEDIDGIESDISSFDQKDIFWLYYRSEGNKDYPQKQVFVTVMNKNYRPNILLETWKYSNYDKIDEIDLKQQKRGWEWIDKYDSGPDKQEYYPYEYRYSSYQEHPEYRLVSMRNNVSNDSQALFDTEGNLVRFPYLSHNDVLRWHRPNLIDALLLVAYRNDYVNNKYDIKKEGKEVQYAIVNKLGLSNESNKRMAKAMAKGIEGGLLYKYSYSWEESIKGYVQRDKAANQVVGEMFRMMNDTALNFLDQIKKDHEEDYKYIYKIERVSNVSFKVKFVTKDLKPKCDVVITYFQVKPFLCDWQIDDIVNYD